jgi:hypothetical protein
MSRRHPQARRPLAAVVRSFQSARWLPEALERRLLLTDFTVTTNADSGPGSLREALNQANATPGPHSIAFDEAITGRGAAPIALSTQLVINCELAMSVREGRFVVLDGQGLTRVLQVDPDARAHVTRVFVEHGRADVGAGIYNRGTLIYEDGGVYENTAGFHGGGIYNVGTLTITTNTEIYDNTARFGGGIANDFGTLEMDDGTDVARNVADSQGGGLYNQGAGRVNIDDSRFFENQARSGGGGIFNGGTLTLHASRVVRNTVTAGPGGGIFNSSNGTITVLSSTVSGNSASRGGGLANFKTIVLVGDTVSGNHAVTQGGGIDNESGTADIFNCTVSDNDASGGGSFGGGIYNGAALDLGSSDVVFNHSAEGGGVTSFGASVFNNTIVADNFRGATATEDNLSGTVNAAQSHANLIGTGSAAGFSNGTNGNLVGVADPGVLPPDDNGGPTPTAALLPTSPAVNHGDASFLAPDIFDVDGDGNTTEPIPFDERGRLRVAGGALDIGPFELSVAPQVRKLLIDSSGWSPAFRQYMTEQGLGNGSGYRLPADGGRDLPWTGLDRVSVEFDRDVAVQADDLLLRGVAVPTYAVRSFQYGGAGNYFVATWLLDAPFARPDRLTVEVDADAGGVTDARTGAPLDGELGPAAGYPSGDGNPGGDHRAAFAVLPGDANGNRVVLADDFSGVKARFFRTTVNPGPDGPTHYDAFYDINGSGSILADDFSIVKSRFFNTLPSVPPVAAARRLGNSYDLLCPRGLRESPGLFG